MAPIELEVWGCRGGRNAYRSRIGELTSCYAVHAGADLYVLDAGRGLGALADAVVRGELGAVARVHVLVTHAHLDHWEGLKDAAWMWTRANGLALTLLGPAEALAAIRRGLEPPSFVPLDVLARGTLGSLAYVEVAAGAELTLPGAAVSATALHHYSGMGADRRDLETLGYRLAVDGGPRVAYLCDHEPTPATRATEDALCGAADLALVDANYGELSEHAFGHGSLAYAGEVAARHPTTWILADPPRPGPHRRRHRGRPGPPRRGRPNLAIARDGLRATWDAAAGRFAPAE